MAEETVKSTVVELIMRAVNEMTEPLEKAEKQLRSLLTDVREVGAAFIEFYAVKESPKLVPDALVGDPDAALGQDQLEIAQAEAEHVIQPYGVADDVGRDAMAVT